MPYKITEACRACGKCARTCPEHAIKKIGQSYKINTSVCVECGRCMSVCPVQAIEPFIETRALNIGIDTAHNIQDKDNNEDKNLEICRKYHGHRKMPCGISSALGHGFGKRLGHHHHR